MIIWDWVSYFFHGVWQSVLLWAPIVKPEVEPVVPYDFFLDCGAFYAEWGGLLDEEQRPTHNFMSLYWDCIWRILIIRIEDRIWVITDKATGWLWAVIGAIPGPFLTVAEWLSAMWERIGAILPDWASDIANGLDTLWNLLPEEIREGLQTWAEFLEGAPGAIRDWVREFVGETIELVVDLWAWYINLGQALTAWWRWAHDQLDEMIKDGYAWIARTLGAAWAFLIWFWSNPRGALASWLSPWWAQLVTFATDCLDFWYNIWGSYAEDLAEFLSDPLEFLWNRGETWLNRRLEQP